MSKPTKTSEQELQGLSALEQNRIVPMPEAERLSGLSEDSLQADHSDQILPARPPRHRDAGRSRLATDE